MTFRKWKEAFVLLICCFLLMFTVNSIQANAEEETPLPTGDILIMYSDGISEEDMQQVRCLVEELTFQSFQVTFAPVTECLGHLQEFDSILCYKIERFPADIIDELWKREQEGNRALTNEEQGCRIMFMGNGFLRSYLQKTNRSTSYMDSVMEIGKMEYSFGAEAQKEALVKEKDFLFLTGELDYTAGQMQVDDIEGYFCARKGCLYHIPVSGLEDNPVKAAASKEISIWKWPYNGEPHIYAQYIVLNEVYPFQDPDKLLEIINGMISKKEPFVISVMPVYHNGNYPAMQHFCEILRYAQANGGVIILHSPINQMPEFNIELVNDYMTTATRIYMEQGVYPMGIQVPRNWLFDENTIEVLSRFRTVLVANEEDSLIEWDEDVRTNSVYKDGHQWIAPAIALDEKGTSFLKTYSSAVYIDITDDIENIERTIQACITSEVPLKSLWDIEHSFWTDEDILTYRNHILLVNGKRTENEFTATEYDEDFEYNRNMLQRFSKDLSSENQKLIVVVVVVSILFLWFIFAARRRNRQQFFWKQANEQLDIEVPIPEKRAKKKESSKMQEPEIQEPEIQEPEIQEPEIQEPEMQELNVQEPNLEDFDIQDISEEDDFEHWDDDWQNDEKPEDEVK